MASKSPEVRKETGTDSLAVLRGTNPANTLFSDIWSAELRQDISVVSIPQCAVLCYSSPTRLILPYTKTLSNADQLVLPATAQLTPTPLLGGGVSPCKRLLPPLTLSQGQAWNVGDLLSAVSVLPAQRRVGSFSAFPPFQASPLVCV